MRLMGEFDGLQDFWDCANHDLSACGYLSDGGIAS